MKLHFKLNNTFYVFSAVIALLIISSSFYIDLNAQLIPSIHIAVWFTALGICYGFGLLLIGLWSVWLHELDNLNSFRKGLKEDEHS